MFAVYGLEHLSASFRLNEIRILELLSVLSFNTSRLPCISHPVLQPFRHFQLCIFAEESIHYGYCLLFYYIFALFVHAHILEGLLLAWLISSLVSFFNVF